MLQFILIFRFFLILVCFWCEMNIHARICNSFPGGFVWAHDDVENILFVVVNRAYIIYFIFFHFVFFISPNESIFCSNLYCSLAFDFTRLIFIFVSTFIFFNTFSVPHISVGLTVCFRVPDVHVFYEIYILCVVQWTGYCRGFIQFPYWYLK